MTSQMIEPGQSASVALVVGPDDTALALRSGDAEVLATPRVVALVEEAAVAALAGRLPEASTTVGTRIDLRHLAPTRVGAEVVATATITSVDGRRVGFSVETVEAGTVVAHGDHDRVVVERAGFEQK